jgi:Raf kinase inhibitor-like YbhB/YbcL family protein
MNKLAVFAIILLILGGGVWFLRKPSPQPPRQIPVKVSYPKSKQKMKISSSAFQNQQTIPAKYTCEGENINPPLKIEDVPTEAKSLVLIVDDPDAPAGTWDHWLVFNIDPTVKEIAEGSIPPGGVQVSNSFGQKDYGGPCPPPGPAHRYFFKIYALDSRLEETGINNKQDLLEAIEEHLLDSAELVGLYSR